MINVGEILYTNVHPFFYHLNREELKNVCRFVPSIPARLNQAMVQGEIDVGAISSFAYAKNNDNFVLMPDLAVASEGRVDSIFLFSKYPVKELDGKAIALTHSSATSVHLLKIIMRRFFEHANVQYETTPPIFTEMMANNDACLLIGDDAIQANWYKNEDIYVYDLGQLWFEFTGLPMTFAVFAIRKQVLQDEQRGLKTLHRVWKESEAQTYKDDYQALAHAVVLDHGGEVEFWQRYFRKLKYRFEEKEKQGLLYYYKLAYEEGYLPDPVDHLSIWNVDAGIRTTI